jgi:hypothetical protein
MQKGWIQKLKKKYFMCFYFVWYISVTSVSQLPFSIKNWTCTENETLEQHIFCIFIDYRGHHRKGVAMYNAT